MWWKLLRGSLANEVNMVFATDLERRDLHKHRGGDQKQMGVNGKEQIEAKKNCFLIN